MRGFPKRKRRKHQNPIPFAISFELTFIPDDLTDWEYEDQVRKIVREKLPQATLKSSSLWEEYDPFVTSIIEEELSRN